MDCIPPGSSVLGILQARILEWVAMPFSGVLNIILNISGHKIEQDLMLGSLFPMSSVCHLSEEKL